MTETPPNEPDFSHQMAIYGPPKPGFPWLLVIYEEGQPKILAFDSEYDAVRARADEVSRVKWVQAANEGQGKK